MDTVTLKFYLQKPCSLGILDNSVTAVQHLCQSIYTLSMNKKVTAASNLSDKERTFGFCVKSLIWQKITFELLPGKFKHWEKRKREFQSKFPWKSYTWSEKPKRFQSGPQTTTCFSIMGFSFQLAWIYFWNVLNSYLLFESFFEGKESHYDAEIKMGRDTLWLKLKLQYSGHLMWRADSLERPWCWERLRAGGKGGGRGWDGWVASPTRWTWVWASSGG